MVLSLRLLVLYLLRSSKMATEMTTFYHLSCHSISTVMETRAMFELISLKGK